MFRQPSVTAPHARPRWIARLRALRLTRSQRQVRQAALIGLFVALILVGMQWGGLFASAQQRAADYLYKT
jgi:CHASE2 domain-containing sensor protein